MNRTGLPGHDAPPRIPLAVICISCPLGASKATSTVSSKYTSQKWKNCSHTLLRNNLHLFTFISIAWVWSAGAVAYSFVSLLSSRLFWWSVMIEWNDKLEMAWRCLFCPGFSALMLASLLTHYNSEHDRFHEERPFHIRCEIDGCTKEYGKINSFTKHVRTVHRKFLWSTSPNDTAGEPCLLEGM